MKLREYFLCAKKTKIMTLSYNFFSSMSVFDACSREYHTGCEWCCWPRSRHSDIETRWSVPCLQAEEDAVHTTVFINMSEDFDGEDDYFFALPHLFELEYTDDELREMDVLHQNAGCCVSSTTYMNRGTLMNARWRLTRREEIVE